MQSISALLQSFAREEQEQWTYKPSFFRLSQQEDGVRLRELTKANPHLVVVDSFLGQKEEWIKATNPERRWTQEELQAEVARQVGDARIEELGVWVYYPWKNTIVHLLDEEEFVFVRTNRNRNKITVAEQAVLCQQKIGIIGLSVGQSIAMTLVMERSVGELRLADFDTLELSNLNRIRAGVHELGVPKVVVSAREIAEIDPFLKVVCFTQGINEENMDLFLTDGGMLNLVLDECDSLDVKVFIRLKARELGIPVVMDTSDRGLIDVERFDLEPNRPIFHGLVEELDVESLRNLSNQEKIPFVMKIVSYESMSSRLKESLKEVGTSILTWPQLASSVMLGAASGADVCRRIALGQFRDSGRYYIDLEELLRNRQQNDTNG